MITWDLAYRLVMERGLELGDPNEHQYEDRKLSNLARKQRKAIALLGEVGKELHEYYINTNPDRTGSS